MCLAALVVAIPAWSQSTAGRNSVSGVVFDSIARAPLANAAVQVALLDSSKGIARGRSGLQIFGAFADSSGRFLVSGLPRGKFAIGFQHEVLSALGVEAPVHGFEVGADSVVTVDLAVPSAGTVRTQRCGPQVAGRDAMLAGYLTDAKRGTLHGAPEVVVQWTELAGSKQALRFESQQVKTQPSEGGSYLVCGLPSETSLDIRVSGDGYRTVAGDIVMSSDGVTRQDFSLADTATLHGTARLAGRVVRADGSPVATGFAVISALGLTASLTSGAFAIAGIPAGTWLVDARAVGYEPQSKFVSFVEGASITVDIVLTRRAQVLEAVSVIGKPGRELGVLNDIHDRMRTAAGTAFLPGNSWLASAVFPVDVVRAARGFTYRSPTEILARPQATSSCPGAGKQIAIYVDGIKYSGGLVELNNLVPMNQVLAIETYPDVIAAPGPWRTTDACAVIAVWTKR